MPVKDCTTCLHNEQQLHQMPCAACDDRALWEPIPATSTPKVDVTISLSPAALTAGQDFIGQWITKGVISLATAEFIQATYAAINEAFKSIPQPLPSPIVPGYYRTRDGRLARAFMRDTQGPFPVLGAVMVQSGCWVPLCWTLYGKIFENTENSSDLVEYLPNYKEDE